MTDCTIYGHEIQNEAMLHDALAKTLRLPAWYGRNLDALHDCLTDLTEATTLTIYGWDALSAALGARAERVKRALEDAAAENPAFSVRLLEAADEI